MATADQNRALFAYQFNQLLGNKLGKPAQNFSTQQLVDSIPEAAKIKAALMQAKIKKTAAPKKTTKKATPGATSAADLLAVLGKGGSNKALGTKALAGGVSPQTPVLDLSKLSAGAGDGGIKGLWKSVDEAITNNPITDALQNNPVTRVAAHALPAALDVVSRPAYAVDEALRRAADAVRQGKSITDIPAEALHGSIAGITGKKKTGFGNVIDPPPVLGEKNAYTDKLIAEGKLTPERRDKIMSDWQHRKRSGLDIWGNRVLGLAGDILTDPTTYLSGGSEVIAKDALEAGSRSLGKAAAKGTLDIGKDALKNRATAIVKKVVDDNKLPNASKLRKGSNINRPLVDHIAAQVHDQIDKVVFDMHKGGMIGGGSTDYGTIAHTIAEGARNGLVDAVSKPAKQFAADLKAGKRFTKAERDAMKAKDPLFGQWLTGAEKIARRGGGLTPDDIFEKANAAYLKAIEPKVHAIFATTKGQLGDALLNVPTVEFMGKKMYLPTVGKGLQKVGQAATSFEHPLVANFNKAWRYSSWFPGYTTHISQKLKSLNVKAYDSFKADVEGLLRDTTKEQRVNIHRAIQEGIQLPGHDGEIEKEVMRHYKQMYYDEVSQGARSEATTPYASDYVYNQVLKGGKAHPDFVNKIKEPKRDSVRKLKSIEGYTSPELTAKGFKVEEDVGQALLSRKAKSIREMSRVNFKKDLVNHYGIRSMVNPRMAEKNGMHLLDKNTYKDLYKNLKPGENLYLDKDIEQIYKNFNELIQYGKNARADAVATGFDKVTKLFKTANTIYWPGFHVRNAVSDIFMGMLDGVKNHRYGQIMNGMMRKDTAKLAVGGERVPFRKIYDSYMNNAATAGFFDSEMKHGFDPRELSTGRFMDSTLKDSLGKVNSKLRAGSQVREDFGRLVHYYHALDEEMTAQLKKGVSRDVAWKNAEEAAIARVNKFKFDYNALTPREQSVRRYGMPFYTYMRKATPVLLENLMMHPKYFSRINRLQNALAPSDEFKGASLPNWMSEMAYSELSSGNHVGFTDALFPTRTLKETFSNPVLRANPIAQGLVEYQTGKDLFSGKPIGKGVQGVTDILKNKWRGITTYRSIESDTKPSVEKWAGLFGIPIVQVTPGRQGQKLRDIEQQITTKTTALNKKLDDAGLKVRVTKGKVYLIQPKSPTADEVAHNQKPKYPKNEKERVLGVYNDFNELLSKLKQK